MNPLSLRATNYRTFEDLYFEFPPGCLAILGANGAGKSSIVNVIDLCLFGPEGRSFADYLTDDGDSTELELELTFAHAGETYRVRRGFSAHGRGKTTLDFERRVGESDEYEPRSRESQKETQALISGTLGLSRATFRASAFLAQGDSAAFTEATPRERLWILADGLGLGIWERLRDACRVDKRTAEREAAELAGRIALLEETGGDVEALGRARDEVRAAGGAALESHARAEASLARAAEQVSALDEAGASYRAAHAQLEAAQARLRERRSLVERAAAAKLEAVSVQQQADAMGAPAERLAELDEIRVGQEALREQRREREAMRDSYLADAKDAQRQAVTLVDERQAVYASLVTLQRQAAELNEAGREHICPTCEQVLAGAAHSTALARIREQLGDAEQRVDAYDERIAALRERENGRRAAAEKIEIPDAPSDENVSALTQEITRWRATETSLAVANQKLAALATTIAEVTPELTAEVARLAGELVSAQDALAALAEPEPGALEQAQVAAVAAKAQLDSVSQRLTESRASLIRADSALEGAYKIAEELTSCHARQERLLGELDLLALLERAYGRDGIPALIVESSAIPQIETEASRILSALGTSYRVELRTQRALKSGDGLADTLDVVVLGEAGERAYESFSGGEKSRLNVALRIALARLLARRRGAESRILVLDEIEYLDAPGQMALANVLKELALSDFDKVVCVSHADTLRDVFDNAITVEKDGNRSRIAA